MEKGEDLIRESGMPYAVVRPCALTEEPARADLIFDQGENITGKVSREEIARTCIAALKSPYALDKTFEVKSVIPFSEPYTVDPENPPPEKDYNEYFKNLKEGITGKESIQKAQPILSAMGGKVYNFIGKLGAERFAFLHSSETQVIYRISRLQIFCFIRITMRSFLILDWLKMVQQVIRAMFLRE